MSTLKSLKFKENVKKVTIFTKMNEKD